MRASPFLCLAVSAAVACGGPPAPPPAPVATKVIATPARGADDFEVARVNGRSVWASCVIAQAAGLPAEGQTAETLRAAALDQCIAFELLAQAAETRGLAAGPEVATATRTAAVNRLVELDFEQRYRSPADLKPAVDALMAKNEWRLHVPELRASAYARFNVPDGAAPEVDAEARALAERLAAALAGQTGLYHVHLTEAANRIAAGSSIKLETAEVTPTAADRLVAPYAQALYALTDVGQATAAVRTKWGWDVIVWTGGIVARERPRDEVVGEMFPELRRRQFRLWVTQLGKQLGVQIKVEQAALEQLDSGEPDDARAPGAAPPAPRTP